MVEHAGLLKDLSIVVVAAGASGFFCRMLHLPSMVGYLLAGMLIGPGLFEQSLIADEASIRQLSELGVVFLMFFLGLEFDLRKIDRFVGPVLAAICLQTALMLLLGTTLGRELGMDTVQCLFFGALLTVSSSMVTIQVLRERGLLQMPHARLAIGILILEDILAILLLVTLTGVGVSGSLSWSEVWRSSFLIGVFVVTVYFVGRLLVRPLIPMLEKHGSTEMLTLVTAAIVLGVGELAAQFHFSVALGAFLAGSMWSETRLVEKIEKATDPLRCLFNAIFFVSVGMLVQPLAIWESIDIVLLVAGCVIAGKVLTCWFGLMVVGHQPRTSFRAAMSKAQVGEFAFVIAALGEQLGVTSEAVPLTSLAIGVGFITILATYPLSVAAPHLFDAVDRLIPRWLLYPGRRYLGLVRRLRNRFSATVYFQLTRRPALLSLAYFLSFNGLLIMAAWGAGRLAEKPGQELAVQAVWLLGGLLALLPLSAMVRNAEVMILLLSEHMLPENLRRGRIRASLLRMLQLGVLCLLLAFCSLLFVLSAHETLGLSRAMLLILAVLAALIVILWRYLQRINARMESIFMDSFAQREETSDGIRQQLIRHNLAEADPWPVHFEEIDLVAETRPCGHSLSELDLSRHCGVTLVAIARAGHTIYDPAPDTILFPGDRLLLIGEKEQIEEARRYLVVREDPLKLETHPHREDMAIRRFIISPHSSLCGDTLAGANLRRRLGINVIGIQHGGRRTLAPGADSVLDAGDHLLVMGTDKALETFRREAEKLL